MATKVFVNTWHPRPSPGHADLTTWTRYKSQSTFRREQYKAQGRGKYQSQGRVDPSAKFHSIPVSAASDIDCHKRKPKIRADAGLGLLLASRGK